MGVAVSRWARKHQEILGSGSGKFYLKKAKYVLERCRSPGRNRYEKAMKTIDSCIKGCDDIDK